MLCCCCCGLRFSGRGGRIMGCCCCSFCCFGCCSGGCSECVGCSTCNTTLCSCCLTGTVDCKPACGQAPTGSCVGICTPSCFSTCCLPYAGMDDSGNDIYQQDDGSLVYADGSPATQCDISCNEGACACTPCSPHSSGSTDQPPRAGKSNKASSAGAPQGGGSGGGTAKPSGGASNPKCSQMTKLTQAMSKFGASITGLLTGGKKSPQSNVLPGQKVVGSTTAVSSNTFLLVILVVGGLLLVMAFGHKPVPD
jgi:hypothetical protein